MLAPRFCGEMAAFDAGALPPLEPGENGVISAFGSRRRNSSQNRSGGGEPQQKRVWLAFTAWKRSSHAQRPFLNGRLAYSVQETPIFLASIICVIGLFSEENFALVVRGNCSFHDRN
jgi:hypothetical protein